VFRGGGYWFDSTFLRTSDRGENTPDFRQIGVGARCARDP
jgi:formylglycine-generating enzyme required for sulfatase activity